MKTVILLTISNVFMTFAWYWHLKSGHLRQAALWVAILASWMIALLEYCFQVPANRAGAAQGLTVAQLKILQEVITLVVFVLFSLAFFPEQKLAWNHWAAFAMVGGAVFLAYYK